MAFSREVNEGTQYQGADESIKYKITSTPWGTAPTISSIVAKDMTNGGTDVSGTVLSGASSVAGDSMTLKALGSLTANHMYRVEVKFTTADGNTWECFVNVSASE